MNKNKLILSFLWLIAGMFSAIGQDIHIAQNSLFPLVQHPSMAGDIDKGKVELGLLYRNQAFTLINNPFETSTAYVNSKIGNWGLGLMILNDRVGQIGLQTNKAVLNTAYHIPINKKNRISIGGQLGYIDRRFSLSNLRLEEHLTMPTGPTEFFDGTKNSYFDFGAGMTYYAQLGTDSYLRWGLTAGHLYNTSSENDIAAYQPLYASFLFYDVPLSSKIRLLPELHYMRTGSFQEITGQARFRISIGNTGLKLGAGYRYEDAIQGLVGLDMGRLEVGFVYERNVSTLAEFSDWSSGLELGLKYRFYKEEKPIVEIPLVEKDDFEIQLILTMSCEVKVDSIFLTLASDSTLHDFVNTDLDFSTILDKNKLYNLYLFKEGYIPVDIPLTTYGIYNDSTILKEVVFELLDKPELVEEVTIEPPVKETGVDTLQLNREILLRNILYKFDDDRITREAENDLLDLLELMNDYPDMEIELSSHTDSRGKRRYNQKLSQRRANSATRWLVRNGIDPHRITSVGYGETKLVNHCSDGVECSKEEHQQNRRTVFEILFLGDYKE